MDNITVIKLKALAKQRGIKGYYKLRKAELIQQLEAHPDANEQVLIPGLDIPRNTTRSVNTSAMLDEDKFYFDSYGVQPPSELIAYLKSPIFYNSERVQQNGEVFCGHLRQFSSH